MVNKPKIAPDGGAAPVAEVGNAAPVFLKKNGDRRLRFGHPWIFSNEIDTSRSPMRSFQAGEPVQVRNHIGRPLAIGYINPHSLICIRVLSWDGESPLRDEMISERVERALRRRAGRYSSPFYRLIYGESDGLPGLVVDRYSDVLVAQITTAGMERLRPAIAAALVRVVGASCLVFKNDAPARSLEGLESYIETVQGTLPEKIRYEENGALFDITPGQGQKTGWYYDHRANRSRLMPHVRGKRVLDLFSFAGAWGIAAAVHGAREVVSVDSSASAIEQLGHHAGLNEVEDRVSALRGDAFDALKSLRADAERFDVVIVDPPALIPRRKDSTRGVEAYRRLNGLAMQLLTDGGLLVSASCSYHLPREKLVEIIARVSGGIGRRAIISEEGHQDFDHPVHPALPETNYLKALFVEVYAE